MKKIHYIIFIGLLTIYSCSSDNDLEINRVNLSLNFMHNWKDSVTVTNADFEDVKFTNENGQKLSINLLRYLVSDVTLINKNGDTISNTEYNLVDVTNDKDLKFTLLEKIPVGTYKSVKFRFGFDEEGNKGDYADLNTASFNVPDMLGGGYHFMQFDGKFIDALGADANFNYHVISAIDITNPSNIKTTNTSFEVSLGEVIISNDKTLEIKVDLSEWFKSPNLWDLNELNTVLMPNYNAQIKMNANGKNVFSLAK